MGFLVFSWSNFVFHLEASLSQVTLRADARGVNWRIGYPAIGLPTLALLLKEIN
jgi:hypothetical protein